MSHQTYFSEFENLIYEGEEDQKDELALNDSFEKYEKESKSEKEIQKLIYVKAKKKERERITELKEKLDEVLSKREELLQQNIKLKEEVEKSSLPTNNNLREAITAAKRQVENLKAEYSLLIGCKK